MAALHTIFETVLETLHLSSLRPLSILQLPIEDLLGYAFVVHSDQRSGPSKSVFDVNAWYLCLLVHAVVLHA